MWFYKKKKTAQHRIRLNYAGNYIFERKGSWNSWVFLDSSSSMNDLIGYIREHFDRVRAQGIVVEFTEETFEAWVEQYDEENK